MVTKEFAVGVESKGDFIPAIGLAEIPFELQGRVRCARCNAPIYSPKALMLDTKQPACMGCLSVFVYPAKEIRA